MKRNPKSKTAAFQVGIGSPMIVAIQKRKPKIQNLPIPPNVLARADRVIR
jgi:hypothetical protein